MSDELIARWVDDRASLSEEEASELYRLLNSDPELARMAKEQLATDELVSRRLALDRRAFENQVAQRLRGTRTEGSFLESTLEAVREERGRKGAWRARLPEAAAAAVLIGALFLILRREPPQPTLGPAAPPRVSHGLRASYFRGPDLQGPSVDRIDPTVDYQWTAGAPPIAAPKDVYSVRWTGVLTPTSSEAYTFHARYDDGVRIWMGGRLILDDWKGRYVVVDRSFVVDLVAGKPVDLKIEYFNGGDRGVMQLYWSSPRHPEEIIPVTALSHE